MCVGSICIAHKQRMDRPRKEKKTFNVSNFNEIKQVQIQSFLSQISREKIHRNKYQREKFRTHEDFREVLS